jgi:hypothetical protein
MRVPARAHTMQSMSSIQLVVLPSHLLRMPACGGLLLVVVGCYLESLAFCLGSWPATFTCPDLGSDSDALTVKQHSATQLGAIYCEMHDNALDAYRLRRMVC